MCDPASILIGHLLSTELYHCKVEFKDDFLAPLHPTINEAPPPVGTNNAFGDRSDQQTVPLPHMSLPATHLPGWVTTALGTLLGSLPDTVCLSLCNRLVRLSRLGGAATLGLLQVIQQEKVDLNRTDTSLQGRWQGWGRGAILQLPS